MPSFGPTKVVGLSKNSKTLRSCLQKQSAGLFYTKVAGLSRSKKKRPHGAASFVARQASNATLLFSQLQPPELLRPRLFLRLPELLPQLHQLGHR